LSTCYFLRSAVGLSLTSILSELIAYVITVAYNVRFTYPFSTWGDILMVTIQQIAIVALVFNYNRATRLSLKIITVIVFFAGSAFLFSEYCSIATLQVLQGCSALIMALGGRVPQIILNYRRGNSGELSGASTGLSVAGNLARVFTTLTLVGDPLILATASSQLVLNSIVFYQILETARREKAVVVAAAAT
jgi:mannose-P-dolichol utilization defect 1